MNFVATLRAIISADEKRNESKKDWHVVESEAPRPAFRRDGYYNRFTDAMGNKVDHEVAEYREYITASVSPMGTPYFSHVWQKRDERGFWSERTDCPANRFAMRSEEEAIARVRELVEGDDRWTHSSEVRHANTGAL